MADSPAIRADGLEKNFGKEVRALDGVSLEVAPATVLVLLGPNGAGKTTVVRILTTILSADAGSASILGHDPAETRFPVGDGPGVAGGPGVDEVGQERVAPDVKRRAFDLVAERLAQRRRRPCCSHTVGVHVAAARRHGHHRDGRGLGSRHAERYSWLVS